MPPPPPGLPAPPPSTASGRATAGNPIGARPMRRDARPQAGPMVADRCDVACRVWVDLTFEIRRVLDLLQIRRQVFLGRKMDERRPQGRLFRVQIEMLVFDFVGIERQQYE